MAANKSSRQRAVATNPENQRLRLSALAMELAEKQLREGTASPLIINHFLKENSEREKLEKELLEAKAENLRSSKKTEEMFAEAMKAFARYSGNMYEDDGGDDDDGDY